MTPEKNTITYHHSLLYITSLLLALLLSGCGPSKEEIAQQVRDKQAAIDAAVVAALAQQARENQVAMQAALEKLKAEVAQARETEERAKVAELAAAKKRKEQEKVSIKGNVFVATKGGSNFKLALIQVTATPKAIFEQARVESIKMIEDSVKKKIEHEINPRIADLKQMMVAFDDRLEIYKTIQSQIKSLENGQEGVYQSLKKLVYYNSDSPSNRATKDRLYQLSLDRRVEAEKLKPLRNNLYEASEDIIKRLSVMQTSVHNSATIFLESVRQSGASSGTSNADGDFALTVGRQDGSHVILSGTGARQNGKEEERYNWVKEVKLEPEQMEAQIFLSNNDTIPAQWEGLNTLSEDLRTLAKEVSVDRSLVRMLGNDGIGDWNSNRYDLIEWVYSKDIKNF